MQLNPDVFGRRYTGTPQRIDREQILKFAAVTLDTNAWHVTGRVAPPAFAILATMGVANRAIADLVGIDQPESYPGLHGEHWIEVSRPLTPGMVVTADAAVVGVHTTGAGTTIVVELRTHDRRHRLVNRQFLTSILPGVTQDLSYGVESPMHATRIAGVADWTILGRTYLPMDLPLRYADVSGDRHPYHVDVRAARAAGLPGTILHGVCALSIASNVITSVICPDDPTRLAVIGVRFARPIACGHSITTRISPFSLARDGSTASFEVVDPSSEVLLKHGLVVLVDQLPVSRHRIEG